MTTTLPCEPSCGAETYCPNPQPPKDGDWSEWKAFWAKHPSRAQHSRPLSYYAATRKGVIDDAD